MLLPNVIWKGLKDSEVGRVRLRNSGKGHVAMLTSEGDIVHAVFPDGQFVYLPEIVCPNTFEAWDDVSIFLAYGKELVDIARLHKWEAFEITVCMRYISRGIKQSDPDDTTKVPYAFSLVAYPKIGVDTLKE